MLKTKANVMMVVENSYPQLNGGGAESQLATISSKIQSLGSNVTIIAQMDSTAMQLTDETVNGINVHRIKYPRIRIIGGIYMLFSLAFYLTRNRNNFDVIHVHIASNMAALCSVIGKLLNKPVLVKLTGWTEMHKGILDSRTSPRIKVLKWAIKRASQYQATSQQIANLLHRRGFEKSKINLIPNAVDTNRFSDIKSVPFDIPKHILNNKLGIFVGRLVEEKNMEFFLTVFSKVFDRSDKISILIIGDGYLKESLIRQTNELKISEQVFFLGPKSNVEDYMNNASFGILPSTYEGLSNTLLEYMASSLPVLGSRVSGTEDIVKPGYNGWLFDSTDYNQLFDCLQSIKNLGMSDLEQMGNNARKFIIDYAGIDIVTNNILNTYFKGN